MRRNEFALNLLNDGGFPQSYNNNVALLAWMAAENTTAAFNPMATTEPDPRSTDFNTAHVKNYPDAATGVQETLETLNNGRYAPILAALHDGSNAQAVAQAVVNSPWGTGRVIIDLIGTVEGNFDDYANRLVGGTDATPVSQPPPVPVVPCNQRTGNPPAGWPLMRLTAPLLNGSRVAEVQAKLYGHGFAPRNSQRTNGTWDGFYGAGTVDAVRAFQAYNSLVADGIVGVQTYCALGIV
jgi:hypothetical protein